MVFFGILFGIGTCWHWYLWAFALFVIGMFWHWYNLALVSWNWYFLALVCLGIGILSFVLSTSVRQDPDTPYGAAWPPRMPLTHTTKIMLLEFCVLNQRPAGSRHSQWGSLAAQNAPYPHHKKNAPRALCSHPASGRIQTLPIGQLGRPECPLPTPQQ